MKINLKEILIVILFIFVQQALNAQWTFEGEMLVPVAGGQAIVMDSKIYILGGYSDDQQATVDAIQEFDPQTGEWRIIGRMKEKRFGLAANIIGNNIYYFGGAVDSSLYVKSFEEFTRTTEGRMRPRDSRLLSQYRLGAAKIMSHRDRYRRARYLAR